ncbi:MAG TPA: hypothetical protein VGH42_12580 [Verrucomicrobiae bacterium]|jgi:hypothetical protein
MPIHINLLAEAQAAEEMRRRDPVKRVVFFGASFVILALIWSGMVEINAVLSNQRLTGVQVAIDTRTNEYDRALANQTKAAAAKSKLEALQKLQSSRFLQGNLLNALQQTVVNGVQLTRLRVDQSYVQTGGTDPQTNGDRVIMGRPPIVRERIILSLDARDFSANPGDQVNKFKDAIASQSYFKAMLDKTNGIELTALSAPQNGPDGKPFVLFTVECHYPDQIR